LASFETPDATELLAVAYLLGGGKLITPKEKIAAKHRVRDGSKTSVPEASRPSEPPSP
jgi:hypothetical protein